MPASHGYSHITDNLWIGGCSSKPRVPDHEFAFVVNCWGKGSWVTDPGTTVVTTAYMVDAEFKPADHIFRALVAAAVEGIRSGEDTLVHCHGGLNRSALVAACALREVFGCSAHYAISLLRINRDADVLYNKTFEQMVHDYTPEKVVA